MLKVSVSVTLENARHLQPGGYEVLYSSSDLEVCQVSPEGIVTAKGPGVFTITAAVTAEGTAKAGNLVIAVTD